VSGTEDDELWWWLGRPPSRRPAHVWQRRPQLVPQGHMWRQALLLNVARAQPGSAAVGSVIAGCLDLAEGQSCSTQVGVRQQSPRICIMQSVLEIRRGSEGYHHQLCVRCRHAHSSCASPFRAVTACSERGAALLPAPWLALPYGPSRVCPCRPEHLGIESCLASGHSAAHVLREL
jgi:hypothetical protein